MEPIAIREVKPNYTTVPKKALERIGIKTGDNICYYVDTQTRSITIRPIVGAKV